MIEPIVKIQFTTLTPIWTGGVDGTSSNLHLTSLIGSLRWWYEVLVRSVGGRACEPEKHLCSFDKNKSDNGLCDVCRVFGATGWARRFKLIIVENTLQPKKSAASILRSDGSLVFNLSRDHPDVHSPGHKWYLPGKPLFGQMTLHIVPTVPLDKDGISFNPEIIGGLFQFIADRASLGAKPQSGLGVIRLKERFSYTPLIAHLQSVEANSKNQKELAIKLPSLQNMFFAEISVNKASESDTFDLKYDLRTMFHQKQKDDKRYTDDLRHTMMGYVRGNRRIGAKIMMSYPYDNDTIRLWGWIPRTDQDKPSRSEILTAIYTFLEHNFQDDFSFWADFKPMENIPILAYFQQTVLRGVQ